MRQKWLSVSKKWEGGWWGHEGGDKSAKLGWAGNDPVALWLLLWVTWKALKHLWQRSGEILLTSVLRIDCRRTTMMSENQLGCFCKHPKEEWWWLSQGANNGKKTSDSVYILEVEPKGYCWLKVQCERRKESRMTPGFYLEQLERRGCYFTEMLSFHIECSWKIPWCLLRTLGVEERVSRPPAESQQASEAGMSMNSHGWMGKRESEKVASLREFSPRKVEETSWNSTRPHLFPLPTPPRNLWRLRWAEPKIPWAGLGMF